MKQKIGHPICEQSDPLVRSLHSGEIFKRLSKVLRGFYFNSR